MTLNYSSIETYTKEKLDDFGFKKLHSFINLLLSCNPYDVEKDVFRRKMFKEQVLINMPILYISSIWIYLHALNNGYETILFATRDCCHLYKIFKALFPYSRAFYFHCSRNMFETATEKKNKDYKKYVESLICDPKKTLFVDIHGTFERAHRYFKKTFDAVPYGILISSRFTSEEDYAQNMGDIIDMDRVTSLIFNAAGSPIEMLNYDLVGTLQTFDSSGPVRDKLEYEYCLIETYHRSIDFIVDRMESIHIKDITKCSMPELRKLLKKLFKCILQDKPLISEKINHVGRHSRNKF
jgi:hypothetical protein